VRGDTRAVQQGVHAHADWQTTVGAGAPTHVAAQGPPPHWTFIPAQLSFAHDTEQGALPHSSWTSPHASLPPPQLRAHACPAGQ